MNGLTAFGLFAVTAMLVCYALEKRSPWFVFAFAVSCALGSVYGFLQGAWPFGLVEGVWSLEALISAEIAGGCCFESLSWFVILSGGEAAVRDLT